MNLEDWQLLQDRLDRAHKNTLNMSFGIKDLWRMHRAVYDKLRLADAEWVNCRRRGQASPRFDELLAQAEEAMKNFEGHILLAKLMDKEPR
jgi:hypothetical protein